MRKIVAFMLTLSLVVSYAFFGETPINSVSAEKVNSGENVVEGSYRDYAFAFENYSDADSDITLNADSAVFSQLAISENGSVSLINTGDYLLWEIEILSDALYQPYIEYTAIGYNDNPVEMNFQLDGEFPFSEAESFLLNRLWKNAEGDSTFDSRGNEFAPEQVESFEKQTAGITDSNGFVTEDMVIALKAGKHTLKLGLNEGKIKIHSVNLKTPYRICEYPEIKQQYEQNGYSKYGGKEIVLEGEAAVLKSSKFLTSMCCRSDAAVLPSDPFSERINYIGGGNWKTAGDTISWEIDVKETGLYKLGFHYHQTYQQEGISYRKLLIDGRSPFAQAQAIPFKYNKWDFYTFSDNSGKPYEIYLTKGRHTVSLSVTLGNLAEFSLGLQETVNKIGNIYRSIVMITGETPDKNRDYNLFTSIPNLEEDLLKVSKTLEALAKESEKIIGSKGGSSAQVLRKATLTIEQMLKKKYKAQTKLSAFYDNYASLSSWLYEMQNMALDIDALVFAAPDKEFERKEAGFFEAAEYSIKRIIASFVSDYSFLKSNSDETEITLWSNWGRDQLRVLSSLITNDFTPKNNINVNLRITDASIVQAHISGNSPDVEIMLARTDPVNYAMRGTLYDLSQFDDYEEVVSRFGKTAMIPYEYNGGVYALPDTQTFSVMFVRTDIFEELELEIPKTWDEFILVSKVLALNNMQAAVGEGATLFLTQKGVSLYTEDRLATNLKSAESIEALSFWTNLYTKNNLPKTYDFFNRFRTGLIPIGVQPYTMYATLKAAAPEINGRWTIAEIPGFENEEGIINNSGVGSGNASVILNASENKAASWEFLKWWTDEETQYRFCDGVEAVLGVTGRQPTANVNALCKLGWEDKTLETLVSQMNKIEEIPEVPGSYYVSRSIQQIYWNVLNNGQTVEEMVDKWATEADDEIYRKTQEYAN